MVILEHADFKIELWLLVYLKKFAFTLLQVEEVNLSLLYKQKKCDQQNHWQLKAWHLQNSEIFYLLHFSLNMNSCWGNPSCGFHFSLAKLNFGREWRTVELYPYGFQVWLDMNETFIQHHCISIVQLLKQTTFSSYFHIWSGARPQSWNKNYCTSHTDPYKSFKCIMRFIVWIS